MKGSTWPVAAVALSLLLTAVAVQAKQAAKRDKDRSSYRIVTIQPYDLLVRTTGGAVCDLTTASECTITMRTIPFGGRNYCLAEAPNVNVRTDTGGGSHLKAIVWRLSLPALDGKPVAFQADSGIVVVDDPKTHRRRTGLRPGIRTPTPARHAGPALGGSDAGQRSSARAHGALTIFGSDAAQSSASGPGFHRMTGR